ncbi:MAG: hypothetical protein ACREPH_08515 [Rhodanobacteraceae bacterium]
MRVHLLSAQIAWREDCVRDGARLALDAAHAVPDDPEALCVVTNVLLETGESAAARACLDRAALAGCADPLLLMRCAALRKRLEQRTEALALLNQAKALGHDTAALRFQRGECLMFNGRIEEAEAELAASLAGAPARGRVAVPLVRLRRQTPERNYLAAIETGARVAVPNSVDQAAFEFARYKALEDLGRDDEAWQALARGNALMDARMHDEIAQHDTWLDRFLAVCPSAIARARQGVLHR